MGLFDPSNQRRTENIREAEILPAAEVLPQFAPGGLAGLDEALDGLITRTKKQKGDRTALLQILEEDRERLNHTASFPAMDRYLPMIYPQMATAADYLPEDAVIFFSESPRVAERAGTWRWQLEEDCKDLLERGVLAGENTALARSFDELLEVLDRWPQAYLDSFVSSQYPRRPRTLLNLMAKALPSYGASLETAVSDLSHYLGEGFAAVVLVASEQRALNLQTLLREQKVRAAVDFQLHALPQPGRAVIAVGGLSGGMEYPGAKAAVLTEGQGVPAKKPRPKAATNRQKLSSYADLSVGDLVVHEHHGIGRYQGMVKMTVDGWTRCPSTSAAGRTPMRPASSPAWGAGSGRSRSPGPKRRCRIWPRALSSSTPSASGSPASPSPRTRPG